jgi:hypothetical protein
MFQEQGPADIDEVYLFFAGEPVDPLGAGGIGGHFWYSGRIGPADRRKNPDEIPGFSRKSYEKQTSQ